MLLEPVGISAQQPPTCCTWVLRKSHIKPACHQSRGLLLCNLMRWASWHQWQGAEELKLKCEYKPPCLERCAHTGDPSLRGSLQDWGLFLSCSRPKGGSEGWQQLPLLYKPSQLARPGIPTRVWAGRVGRGDVLSHPHGVTSSQAQTCHHRQVACLVTRPSPLSAALTGGAGGCLFTCYFSSWHKSFLFVAAGGWLSHTKPNREAVSFPAIFKDQKNAWHETQGFSQALSPTRLRGTKLKQLSNTPITQLDLGPVYGFNLAIIHPGDS